MDLVAEVNKDPGLGRLSVLPENQLYQVCPSQKRPVRQITNHADIEKHNTLEMQLRAAISGEVAEDVTALSLPALQPDSFPGSPSLLSARRSESGAQTNLHPTSESNGGKEAMIDDLDNYIPVGVLKSFNAHSDGSNIDGMASKASLPETEVLSLEREKWIRTSVCKNKMYPTWSALRVYVLPDDIGRKSVPRSSPALRRALKLVMSKVDSSLQAWEGRFDPASDTVTESDHGDESLFYIFNTLDSPSPDIQKVSDPYARIAMEDVLWKDVASIDELSESIDVPGLKTPLYSYQRRSAAFMIQRESEPAQALDPRLQVFQGPTGQTFYYDKEEGSIVREERLYSEACGGMFLAVPHFR